MVSKFYCMFLFLYLGKLSYSEESLLPTPSKLSKYTACNIKEAEDYQSLLTYFTAANNAQTKIFLVGDSIIGQMCRNTNFCRHIVGNGSLDDDNNVYTHIMKPNYSSPNDWGRFNMHQLSAAPNTTVYNLGQYGATMKILNIFEEELFRSFFPTSADVMFILFGAHIHEKEVRVIHA